MFTNQAMILLEWACRLCAGDTTNAALDSFSQCLDTVNPRYFTPLPTTINSTVAGRPNLPKPRRSLPPVTSPLLWLLFDLVRNGVAHQYQQIIAHRRDGYIYVSLGGPSDNQRTIELAKKDGPGRHLSLERARNGLGLIVRPEWLYLDFKSAIDQAGILSMNLRPDSLARSEESYRGLTVNNFEHALTHAHYSVTLQTTGSWANYAPSEPPDLPVLSPRSQDDSGGLLLPD